MHTTLLFTTLVSFALVSTAFAAGERVAVLPFTAGDSVTATEAHMVTNQFAQVLSASAALTIMDSATQATIVQQKKLDLAACSTSVQRKQFAADLGVDGLLIGSVSRADEMYEFDISLISGTTGRNLRHVKQQMGPGILEDLARDAAKKADKQFLNASFPKKPLTAPTAVPMPPGP